MSTGKTLAERQLEILGNLAALLQASIQLQQQSVGMLAIIREMSLDSETRNLQRSHSNPLNGYGKKCFSQTDEDGITLEIIRRLGLEKGNYLEFGVGDGTENNTLILAALGWRGFWVGGEDLAFKFEPSPRFMYFKNWIEKENIVLSTRRGCSIMGFDKLDVISIDLDGNDFYFVETLLESGVRPSLFIVEYNAQFPPPVEFKIAYDPKHKWMGDNYFGASLTSFDKLFNRFNFRLVCCNSHTGSNAFFIDKRYDHLFNDVPIDVSEIYVPPRYRLQNAFGHRQSLKVIQDIFTQA